MTEQPHTTPASLQDDEISLLDLLLVVVDNLRLLLLGSLLGGLLAYAISFLVPPTFESLAIVKGTQQTASLLTTAQVLDPVIDKLQLKKSGESLDLARQRLKKNDIKVNFNAKDGLVSLTAQAQTPEFAQALADELLKSYFGQSKPRGSERKRLEALLFATEERLKEASATAHQLNRRLSREDAKASVDLAQGYATLLASIDALEKKQQDTLKELQGFDDSQLLQSPTINQIMTSPKQGLIAMIATLATGFALLLFVFCRQALYKSSKDDETAGKVAELKASWRRALGKS